MTLKTRVTGIDRLKAKAKRLPEIARVKIAAAMEAAARDIVADMKRAVPRDEGELERSITWKAVPDTDGTAIEISAGGGDAYYAKWVEFGTPPGRRKRKTKSGAVVGYNHPGTRPQPFFFPAIRMNRKKVRSRISRAYTAAAKEIGKQK